MAGIKALHVTGKKQFDEALEGRFRFSMQNIQCSSVVISSGSCASCDSSNVSGICCDFTVENNFWKPFL